MVVGLEGLVKAAELREPAVGEGNCFGSKGSPVYSIRSAPFAGKVI